ncbi:uncharacterized protein [Spinacia oleracea]|uniref:Endonuclease/exonuclease/phosphatase domain-containing protein n=1 Tax=Spinacia oleracea TaxID=3562 RepID=A0ABM3RS90_SPIOL|nr:uncharacterized protein LOC130472083 [Spinacia oleracea]
MSFFCTFIYSSNDLNDRYKLWDDLIRIGDRISLPWIVCGDFNNPLNFGDRLGAPISAAKIEGFKNCVALCGLSDIKSDGCFFTWNNKQSGSARFFSKIDRVLGNDEWMSTFPDSLAQFLPEGLFDHCPAIVCAQKLLPSGKRPFQYFNMWGLDPSFLDRVKESWDVPLYGVHMYQLFSRLKRDCQEKLHASPGDPSMSSLESVAVESYRVADTAFLSFLRQKSKLYWLKDGDANTSFFHRSIKLRRQFNSIHSIQDGSGICIHSPDGVTNAFVMYYKSLLGATLDHREPVRVSVVQLGSIVPDSLHAVLCAPFSDVDIQKDMFSIDGKKAPGPDGFTSQFFKDSWSVVGLDVCNAVKDLFLSGKLLREIDATSITLVPKSSHPTSDGF